MCRTEGVVDVGIDAIDQLGDECGIVALLPRVEPQVLEQLDTGCQLTQTGAHCVHRVLRVRLALGPAEVAGGDHGGAALGEPVDRGERGADAEVVGDLAVLHRNVEIGANEHPLTAQVAQVGQRGHVTCGVVCGGVGAHHFFFAARALAALPPAKRVVSMRRLL